MIRLSILLGTVMLAWPVLAQASGPHRAVVGDVRVIPFDGGCFSPPAEWHLRADGGMTILAGDCPPGGGYYTGPFAETSLTGNLSAGPDVEKNLLALSPVGDTPFGAPTRVEASGAPRAAYTLYDWVGNSVARIVVIAGPAADYGPEDVRRVAEEWMRWLRRENQR